MKILIFSIIIFAGSLLFSGCNGQNVVVRNSRPGWLLSNDQIDLFITRNGGHMAPVFFNKSSSKPIQPYYISPWQDENTNITHPLLDTLRGDFFCMPFGANSEPYNDEKHYVHGDTANRDWNFVEFRETETINTISGQDSQNDLSENFGGFSDEIDTDGAEGISKEDIENFINALSA